MFGIGFGELLVLTFIGILILGPSRCISVAKAVGKTWGKLRRELNDISKDISLDDELKSNRTPAGKSKKKTIK